MEEKDILVSKENYEKDLYFTVHGSNYGKGC